MRSLRSEPASQILSNLMLMLSTLPRSQHSPVRWLSHTFPTPFVIFPSKIPPHSSNWLIELHRRDIIGKEGITKLKESLSVGNAPVEVRRFEESGHLAHLDEREEYLTVWKAFLILRALRGCLEGRPLRANEILENQNGT